jgi:undecaprenol kinase
MSIETPQKFTATSAILTKPKPGLIPAAWQEKTGRATTMIESFYHAFHGIWVGLKEERNVRLHLLSSVLVLAMGWWLKVDMTGWALLAMAVGLVLTTEFINTALEHLVDLSAEGQYHRSARYAKDTAAAAVLCASLLSLVIGALVFGPRLLALWPAGGV